MLVKGDNLLDELKKIYKLCDVEKVNEVLEQFTSRRYRSLEVAYYNRAVYWVIIFEDDTYTVLDAEGKQIEDERLDDLKNMIEASLSAQPYIGLKQEAEAQQRAIQAKKSVLSKLIRSNGKIKTVELISEETFNFNNSEYNQAVEELVAEGWINESENKTEIFFPDEDQGIFYSHLSSVYHFLLGGKAQFDLIGMLKSNFYTSHINEQFVAEIQRIQGNLPLSDSDIQDAIKILKLSPSAVLWAVQPDQMIITHRNNPKFNFGESMDRFDRNYFFRELYRSLRHDLTHPIARTYLLDVFKIREIETKQKIIKKITLEIFIIKSILRREPFRQIRNVSFYVFQFFGVITDFIARRFFQK